MKSKLLGLGSVLCSAYIILLVAAVITLPFYVDMEEEIPVPLRPVFVAVLIFSFIAVLGIWFFIIFDIIHVARNPALSGGAKAGWICAIWVLNVFAIPVYWFKHQRETRKTAGSSTDAAGLVEK